MEGLGLTSALSLVAVLGLRIPVLPFLMGIVAGISQTALLLESTPNEQRGRVFSLMILGCGFNTVGSGVDGFAIRGHRWPYYRGIIRRTLRGWPRTDGYLLLYLA